MDQIIIKNIFKIFGPDPQKAKFLIDQGLTKEVLTRYYFDYETAQI